MSSSGLHTRHSDLSRLLQHFYAAPLRAISRVVNAQNSLLRLPLDGCKYLAEACLTLFLRLLVFLGISTPGFVSREQVSSRAVQKRHTFWTATVHAICPPILETTSYSMCSLVRPSTHILHESGTMENIASDQAIVLAAELRVFAPMRRQSSLKANIKI